MDLLLIGGAAIESHGQHYRTDDVDVAPQRPEANLRCLAGALNQLACKLVVDPGDPGQDVAVPGDYSTAANLRRQNVWNLASRHGKLDITFEPSGFPGGYDQLHERSRPHRVTYTSIEVRVAAPEDVEHSKRTRVARKDLDYLATVGRLSAPEATPPRMARGDGGDSEGSVSVLPALDAQDDHFARFLLDAIQDPVGAAAR